MSFIYLGAILFSLAGMLLLDWRHRLAFFDNWKRAAITIAVGLGIFLIWDVLGISLGIFFEGNSSITTGIMRAPELPLEDLFFLTFLCYFTLIGYRILENLWRPISS